MSFDKTKVMRSAERFLSQGKLRAAISEYKKIVENDPRDFSTLNLLGDLYVKGNEENQAVGCFMQVADHYSKQGFSQKAIAVYNKITRIQPNSPNVSAKLAKLYQLKGSFAEARSHYTALAEQYQRKGQKGEALEIWKQIAQLDPGNTEVYLKIAESCWQDGQKDEAAKAFTEAGLRFANLEQHEPALTAFSRALEIRPYDLTALNGFVKTQIYLGCADEAAKNLEKILEQQPYNREILYLLIDCHLDSNNPGEAEKAVIKLVEQEPANYPKFLQLVEIYLKNNELESAVRILSMSSEHLLVGGKPEEFLGWTNEILTRDPEQVDAQRLLVRYYGWQRDEAELRKSLERLAEIARLKESVDDERYALSQLVMIVPHEIEFARRLQEINYQYGAVESHPSPEFEMPKADTDVPAFDSFENFSEEENAEHHQELFHKISQFDGELVASSNGNGFHINVKDEFFQEGIILQEDAVSEIETRSQLVEPLDEEKSSELKLAAQLHLEQELESIEFYIAQGYQELAEKSIVALEEEYGPRAEFATMREQMDDSLQTLAEKTKPQVEILEAENLTERIEKAPEIEDRTDFDINEFRNELGFEEAETSEEGDYDTHYQMAIAYKEMGLMEDSIREFQDAVNLVQPDDGTRRFFKCCNLLGHCFMESGMPNLALMWYRRAMETPNLSDEENQALLYESGNAYEMGGEKPKALELFEQVYAVNVDYRDVSERLENLRGS